MRQLSSLVDETLDDQPQLHRALCTRPERVAMVCAHTIPTRATPRLTSHQFRVHFEENRASAARHVKSYKRYFPLFSWVEVRRLSCIVEQPSGSAEIALFTSECSVFPSSLFFPPHPLSCHEETLRRKDRKNKRQLWHGASVSLRDSSVLTIVFPGVESGGKSVQGRRRGGGGGAEKKETR